MAEELKPCPSCGTTDVFLKEQKPVFFVACAYCSMQGPETLRKKRGYRRMELPAAQAALLPREADAGRKMVLVS